jgi:hypothetical protein
MKRALLLLSLFAASLAAQVPCSIQGTLTGAGASTVLTNTNGCFNWRVSYTSTGFSALSVQLEGSPDGVTYSAFTGAQVTDGSNPSTTTGAGVIGIHATAAYVELRLNSESGTGSISFHVWGANSSTPVGNLGADSGGGFTNPMTTLGDMIYEGPSAPNRVAGNITNGLECLLQLGTGSASSEPYWDTCPTASTLTYYFTANASSPTVTYYEMSATHPTSATNLSTASVPSNAVLENFATDAGVPNLTSIPPGSFDCHVRAYKAGGSTTTLYCEIWEVSSAEVDIAKIGTTEMSPPITTSETGYDLHYIQNNSYTMASPSSRIVARVWENSVATPTIVLVVGGESDAHLSLPSSSIDVTSFVPYSGAINNVSLGSHTIQGASFTGDSGSGGTSGLVPAPNAGDAAAGKYLAAGGGWSVPSGGGGGGGPTVQSVVTGSRLPNVVYQNTLSSALYVSITAYTGSTSYIQILNDSSATPTTPVCAQFAAAAANDVNCFTIVLSGNYYELTSGSTVTVDHWLEWH